MTPTRGSYFNAIIKPRRRTTRKIIKSTSAHTEHIISHTGRGTHAREAESLFSAGVIALPPPECEWEAALVICDHASFEREKYVCSEFIQWQARGAYKSSVANGNG